MSKAKKKAAKMRDMLKSMGIEYYTTTESSKFTASYGLKSAVDWVAIAYPWGIELSADGLTPEQAAAMIAAAEGRADA